MSKQSKAEKAVIRLANLKADELNYFYEEHKETIDKYLRLQMEHSDLVHKATMMKVDRVMQIPRKGDHF